MRRFHHLFIAIFISTFLLISLIIVPSVKAADLPLFPGFPGVKTIFDYGKEFCDKRSGDLMNLETWYSGKCAPGSDTLSGDGVGFSDIVMLQGVEYLIGPQYNNFQDLILNLIKGLQCASNPASCLTTSQAPSPSQGIIPGLAKITSTLFTVRPASSIDYFSYVASNLKKHEVINQAFAAGPGYGFTALSPILPLWRAFRNVSYLLFAFGFVLYGIMIMFRIKIDAKTAATVQLAIPKLIFTLILITFSYAIVGLLVDMSTIAVAMSVNILKAGGILTSGPNGLVDLASGNKFGSVGSFAINTVSAIIVSPFIVFNLLIGGSIGAIIAGIVGVLSVTTILGFFGVIIVIIIFIAIIISFSKLIMQLFSAYFSVIVSLIFAPIILLGNIMPGSNAVSSWMLGVFGNLAVFPVASFFLVLSYALMAQPLLSLGNLIPAFPGGLENILGVHSLSTTDNLWTPPMTIAGGITSPLTGNSLGSLMLATVGFGLLLMASKYVDMVRDALKVPAFKYGTAISDALKGGYKGVGTIPSVGSATWYKETGKIAGLPAGTPFGTNPVPQTPPLKP